MRIPARSLAAVTALAAFGAGGTALAQSSGGDPTTITVTPVPDLKAGDIAPFDAAGVPAIRRGRPIPKGYVLPGYRVQTDKGAKTAGAALRFACPGATRLRTFAFTGNPGLQTTGDYVGHKTAIAFTFPSGTAKSDGRTYAVCH